MSDKGNLQPSGLIGVLLDKGAEYGDRHDAAMDLGNFDDKSAMEALEKIIDDKSEDLDLRDECSQSLLDIKRKQSNYSAKNN